MTPLDILATAAVSSHPALRGNRLSTLASAAFIVGRDDCTSIQLDQPLNEMFRVSIHAVYPKNNGQRLMTNVRNLRHLTTDQRYMDAMSRESKAMCGIQSDAINACAARLTTTLLHIARDYGEQFLYLSVLPYCE